jgi:hypothetical protein
MGYRYVLFQKVSSLTVFVPGNAGDHELTALRRVVVLGTPVPQEVSAHAAFVPSCSGKTHCSQAWCASPFQGAPPVWRCRGLSSGAVRRDAGHTAATTVTTCR